MCFLTFNNESEGDLIMLQYVQKHNQRMICGLFFLYKWICFRGFFYECVGKDIFEMATVGKRGINGNM